MYDNYIVFESDENSSDKEEYILALLSSESGKHSCPSERGMLNGCHLLLHFGLFCAAALLLLGMFLVIFLLGVYVPHGFLVKASADYRARRIDCGKH